MASSEIQTESDSETEIETAVAEPALDINAVTIDDVFTALEYGDFKKLREFVEQDSACLSSRDDDGGYALHWAALYNRSQIMKYIIQHDGDVNAVNNDHQTALHCAAFKGSILVADVLLQNGADVEVADLDGDRAVHIASQNGQTSFLNHIVAKYNAHFDVPNNNGERPLHQAAFNNHPETVQYIIEHDGGVNAVDNTQRTALHFSALIGSISVAEKLLQNGAHVEAADVFGDRAVHLASQNGQTSFLNHIVAKYNAHFDVPNNNGERPLHYATINNHLETVQYIIEHGGDVNAVDNSQRTALHLSAIIGSVSVANVLLQNGAHIEDMDVNGVREVHIAAQNGQTSFLKHIVAKYNVNFDVPDNDGKRPLHWAVINNHPEIVKYIIENGADVNAVDNDQWTALHFSANEGSISTADVLLQNGAKVEAVDVDGKGAVHIAAQNGQTSFLNHIVTEYNVYFDVSKNDGERPLHGAAINNHPETVQYIIEHGGDANAVDNNQRTALHFSAMIGSISVADVLLQNMAHVEAADVDGNKAVHIASQYGKTSFLNHIVAKYNAHLDVPNNIGERPLHHAALNNYPETVQNIIEHGGDVNAVDNSQGTALHSSALVGSISVADLLLQNGADVEAADVDGNNAVHFAALKGKTSFLNHIVTKHNADFDVPNNEGMSPLHKAACEGFVDTVKWLVSRDASQKRQDILGRTPLHWAAFQDNLEVCTVLMDAGTEQDIMVKDNEGNTPMDQAYANNPSLEAIYLSRALRAECKHLQHLNFKGEALQKGTNWPMIIAIQGDDYTGKTYMALNLASRLKCSILSLDDFLDASEHTNEKDTLISHTFNLIAHIVKTQISLGLSIVIDSPLSRLSHLLKLFALVSTKNSHNTRLVIIECKPENEYVYQLRFEEGDSAIYASRWHKPAGVWPLPKVPRDYTDDDIPYGVSKLVVDTNDHYSQCRVLRAVFDVVSCGYGHKTKYSECWQVIHKDKEEQFTCPCPHSNHKKTNTDLDMNLHVLTLDDEGWDHWDKLCGICDNQIHGSVYTCRDCPLALHESCAELASDEKVHFAPESFPIFLPSEPDLRYTFPIERPCAECRKDGNSFSCKCMHCLFESHLKSRLVPTIVRHPGSDYFLTLWLNSDVDGSIVGYTCLACRKEGQFAAYVCGFNSLYHPKCALLPPSVHHSHGGYNHDLEMITRRVEKEEDYMCDCCSIKMDPTAWYYYCTECNIQLHLECAFLDFDTLEPIKEACS